MRIVYLAHLFPLPMDSGAKLHTFYYLSALASKHEVHAIAFMRYDEERANIQNVAGIVRSLGIVDLKRSRLKQVTDAVSSLLHGDSFIVTRDFREEMRRTVSDKIAEVRPDIVYIDHLQMAQFVEFGGPYKVILDHHNVESMIIKRISQTSHSLPMRLYARIEWPKLLKYELDVCKRCDMVFTVTEEDKALLCELEPSISNIHALPVGIDLDYFGTVRRDEASNNILSIATMYWPPNVDSMLYFYRDIFPMVVSEMPDCRLTIAGQRPVASIQALAADPRVTVTGYVDDIRDVARDCGVFIVPLRSGSGLRQKILNALGMGLPIVSTSVGAEGLDLEPGKHILIADTPRDFADSVLRVLRDRELARRLGEDGRAVVREKYSRESICSRMLALVDTLRQGPVSAATP